MRRLVVEIFTGERMSSAAKNDPAIVQIFKEIKSLELLTILKRSESGAEFIVRITFKNPEYEIEKFSLFERMEFQILETDLTNGTYILFLKTKFVNKSKEDRHGTEIPDFFVTGLKYDNGTVKISLLGSSEVIKSTLDSFEKLGFYYKVVSLSSAKFPLNSPIDQLTRKQYKVVETAFKLGYYDIPRKINSDEIASRLGMVNSNFVTHRRRAEKRIMENLFFNR